MLFLLPNTQENRRKTVLPQKMNSNNLPYQTLSCGINIPPSDEEGEVGI